MEKTTKFVVQYNVREYWHDWYGYNDRGDAFRAADKLPSQIGDRPVRVIERTTTDHIITMDKENG